jgi:hypothetical protein
MVNTIGAKEEEGKNRTDKQTRPRKYMYLVVDECSILQQNILNGRKISFKTSNDQLITQRRWHCHTTNYEQIMKWKEGMNRYRNETATNNDKQRMKERERQISLWLVWCMLFFLFWWLSNGSSSLHSLFFGFELFLFFLLNWYIFMINCLIHSFIHRLWSFQIDNNNNIISRFIDLLFSLCSFFWFHKYFNNINDYTNWDMNMNETQWFFKVSIEVIENDGSWVYFLNFRIQNSNFVLW